MNINTHQEENSQFFTKKLNGFSTIASYDCNLESDDSLLCGEDFGSEMIDSYTDFAAYSSLFIPRR